jgi:hypothetical protein
VGNAAYPRKKWATKNRKWEDHLDVRFVGSEHSNGAFVEVGKSDGKSQLFPGAILWKITMFPYVSYCFLGKSLN